MSSPQPRPFEAVLFDWDDTLCVAAPHRYLHAQESAAALGIEHSLREIHAAFRRAGDSTTLPWAEFRRRLPGEMGIPAEHEAAFRAAYLARDEQRTFALFDDVLDLFERVGPRNLRLGIISNNEDVDAHMQALNVHHHFDVVVSPTTFGVAKPNPEVFRRTLAQMQVAPERVLYVGDSYDNDVTGALAAGLTPVLIDRFSVHDDEDGLFRVESLAQLDDLLERLLHGDAPVADQARESS